MSVQQVLPLDSAWRRRSSPARIIVPTICWSPEMVKPGSKVLDVGCGDGDLLQLLESPRHRRARHRAVARGRQPLRRQGPRGGAGRRRHRPDQLSRRRLRLRDPVADAAGDAAAAASCWKICCASAAAPSCRSRISASGRCGFSSWSAATCRAPRICRRPGTTPPTSISAPSRISSSSATRSTSRWSAPRRSISTAVRCRLRLPWWVWNMFGEQGVFSAHARGREKLTP